MNVECWCRYSELPVRHNEDVLNEGMAKGVRFAVGGGELRWSVAAVNGRC